MTQFAIKVDGDWQEIVTSFSVGDGDECISFPVDWAYSASDADRLAYGITPITEPTDLLDPTRIFKGYTLLSDALGMPIRVAQYDDYTLDQAKAIHWNDAKAYRDTRMGGGAMTPGGMADTTQTSLTRANGTVGTAIICTLLHKPWTPIVWTMADNSTYTLDSAVTAIDFAQSIATFVLRCQNASLTIRNAINVCTTASAVFAVDITAGYPNA